jgi:hypothetical protein
LGQTSRFDESRSGSRRLSRMPVGFWDFDTPFSSETTEFELFMNPPEQVD